ncbi:MAG: cytochrome c family protein [Rhodospirillales bacterium]|nr:cytochrome c family protein [Rhodospirillales bacterium]
MPARRLLAVAALAALTTAPLAARAQDAAAGEAVFKKQCAICHSPVQGKNMIGPSLFGIVGRTAGTVPNFRYSPANKNSGIVWDAAKLDPYLTNPKAVVPGTIMTYAGLKDATQRADLIAYLETLK